MYPVYVPSRYRSSTATTPVLLSINDIPHNILVNPSEKTDYAKTYTKSTLIPSDKQISISSARHAIVDICKKKHPGMWCWMFDDDVTKVGTIKSKKFTEINIKTWMTEIQTIIEKIKPEQYDICQIGFQFTSFNVSDKLIELNTNINCIQLIYIPLIAKHKIQYNTKLKALEDTDFCINLLNKGLHNLKMNRFYFYTGPSGLRNKNGGLANLYSSSGKEKAIQEFKKLYPDLITVDSTILTNYRIKWNKFKNNVITNKITDLYSK